MTYWADIDVEPDEEEGFWLASFKSVWLWFERQQLKIANRVCAEASAAVVKTKNERKAAEKNNTEFGAVANIFVPQKKAADFTINSARDLLYYVAEIRYGGDPRNYAFGASRDKMPFSIEAKWRPGKLHEDDSVATHELYSVTGVSKYTEVARNVEYLGEVAAKNLKRKRDEEEEDKKRNRKNLPPKKEKL